MYPPFKASCDCSENRGCSLCRTVPRRDRRSLSRHRNKHGGSWRWSQWGAGFGFSEDLSIGTGTSVSGLYAMDQSGQPAILINTPSLNFPAILTNKPGWTIVIAVQAGAQLFMSPKYVPGLGGPSAGVSGSSGPVAIDVNTNGASVTLGAGAGSRAGVSGAVSPTFVFLVCKD